MGKSAVALLLAERMGGEIISVDSMQVYRGLDIGTAKPSAEDRARVPHHLIDVVEVTEPFDAAQFVRQARAAESDIRSRGRVLILCGGTGLYFKALLDGLGDAPAGDAALRAELERAPLADLLRELEKSDPATYERIDRQNPRRVIRAVEVIRLTGRPFSAQRDNWAAKKGGGSVGPPPQAFGLARSGVDLHRRIEARVDAMFARGLVAETHQLLKHGLAVNKTAMQALGYRQVIEHLRGGPSLTETIELVKARTRQFARRQKTWFRHQMELTWLELGSEESVEVVVERISTAVKGAQR